MKKILVFLVLVGIMGTGFAWAKDGKIGVVYLRRVFESYEKTKAYDEKLANKSKQIEEKIRDLRQEIQKIQASIEVLGEKERSKKIKELREKQMELRKYQIEAMRNIGQEREKYMREILQDIKPVINAYAEKNGYDVILNGDMILYSAADYDLTDDIVKLLNKNYETTK